MSAVSLVTNVVAKGGFSPLCPADEAGALAPAVSEGTLGTARLTDPATGTALPGDLTTPPPQAHSSAARTITATGTHPTTTTLAVRRMLVLSDMFSSRDRRQRRGCRAGVSPTFAVCNVGALETQGPRRRSHFGPLGHVLMVVRADGALVPIVAPAALTDLTVSGFCLPGV